MIAENCLQPLDFLSVFHVINVFLSLSVTFERPASNTVIFFFSLEILSV